MRLTNLTDDELKSEMDSLQRELYQAELRYKPLRSEWNRRKRAAEKSRRPKANKVKGRKVRRVKSEVEKAWDAMLDNATECEACGWRPGQPSPSYWRADNCLDRAHIIGGTGHRIKDARLCIILCRACHYQQTNGRAVVGCPHEPLTLGNLHWLKMQHDDYDPVFIRKCNANRPLAIPVALPEEWGR